jgi:hypothetical protein
MEMDAVIESRGKGGSEAARKRLARVTIAGPPVRTLGTLRSNQQSCVCQQCNALAAVASILLLPALSSEPLEPTLGLQACGSLLNRISRVNPTDEHR